MNKQKFIDLLRNPKSTTEDNVTELESVVNQFPYFQSAHIVLAKGSKEIKAKNTPKRISMAAMYSTDRVLLKKYMSGDLIFLDPLSYDVKEMAKKAEQEVHVETPPPAKPKEAKKTEKPRQEKPKADKKISAPSPKEQAPSPKPGRNKIPPLNIKKSDFDAEEIIDEIKSEFEEFKKNKKLFDEYIQGEEERKAVEEALKKAQAANPPEEPVAEVETTEQKSTAPDEEPISSTVEDAHAPEAKPDVPEKLAAESPQHSQTVTSRPKLVDLKIEHPEPKPSGYAGKILIEGSNKDVEPAPPEEEVKDEKPARKKRKVTKVKAAPDMAPAAKKEEEPESSEKAEEVKAEAPSTDDILAEIDKETESLQEQAGSEPTVEEQPKETEPTPESSDQVEDSSMTKPSKEENDKATDTNVTDDLENVEATEDQAIEETEADESESAETDVEESEPAETEVESIESKEKPKKAEVVSEIDDSAPEAASIKQDEVDEQTTKSESVEEDPKPEEKEDAKAAKPEDSEGEDVNLEVNDASGFIEREVDKFDIKKDKKLAGKLRKEKMRKLREQRGIIDDLAKEMPAEAITTEGRPEVKPPKKETPVESEKTTETEKTEESQASQEKPAEVESKAVQEADTTEPVEKAQEPEEPKKAEAKSEEKPSQDEQKDIIDDFIQADPQMPSPKSTSEKGDVKEKEDLAAKSQKQDDEMISENLAIIYKNQGKLKKAIEIYEKLILKFPEKQAYFAARIEDLKKQ